MVGAWPASGEGRTEGKGGGRRKMRGQDSEGRESMRREMPEGKGKGEKKDAI